MKLLIGLAIIYSSFLLIIYFYQKNLLFFPDKTPLDQCPEVTQSGGSHYESPDKATRLYVIRTQKEKPKGWVLHFHGNGGRACDRFLINKNFLELGYHLILAEYPGYAEEAPLPSEKEILRSAEASYAYLAKENQNDFPIVLFGESLGTAPATYLVSKNLKNVKALILQTPFPSLAAVGQSHYFYFPVGLLLKHKFNARKWAKDVKVPIFVFHGEDDEVIPFKLGKRQAENFSSELVTFWGVKGARHNDLSFVAGQELWRRIRDFLKGD